MPMRDATIQPDTMVQSVGGVSVTETEVGMFLMDVRHGYLFRLNRTGRSVWQLLRDPIRVRELCERIAVEYNGQGAQFADEIMDLLDSLLNAGLIRVQDVESY